jgi:hypothetical protein
MPTGSDLFSATTDLPLGVVVGYGKNAAGTASITKTAIVIDPAKGVSLYAYWFSQVLPPIEILNPVFGVGSNSNNNTPVLTIDDVEYWVITFGTEPAPSDSGLVPVPGSNAPSRLAYVAPSEAAVYDRITIYYETVLHEDTAVAKGTDKTLAVTMADAGSIWSGSDAGYPELKEGTGELTYTNAGFMTSGVNIKANTYAGSHVNFFLLRITKIVYSMD